MMNATVDDRKVQSALSRLDKEMEKHLKKAVRESSQEFRSIARRKCISKNLRKTIRVRYEKNKLGAKVGTSSPLAHLLEGGVSPHTIRAKGKGILAFKGAIGHTIDTRKALYRSAKTGKVIKSKKRGAYSYINTKNKPVHHPGMNPTPFMEPAWKEEKPRFSDRIKYAVKKAGVNAGK